MNDWSPAAIDTLHAYDIDANRLEASGPMPDAARLLLEYGCRLLIEWKKPCSA